MNKFSLSIFSLAILGISQSALAEASSNSTVFNEAQCLALKASSIFDTEIQKVEWNAGGEVPADRMSELTGGAKQSLRAGSHCIVEGEIAARTGADGKHYGIKFQLRLPENWNNKFLFQGGGGLDGFVAPAVGAIPVRTSTATPALMRGYAVMSMDSGHPTPTPDFGADQQARLDYAYQAIGKATPVAKQLIQTAYQQKAKHHYFMGCSNGGRAAMMAAQRYPLEFDGVIAANPGFRLSRAAVAEQWDNQQLMKIAPTNEKGEKIFANALTQVDLDKVVNGVLAQCDAKDGLKDGIINGWEKCDFTPDSLDLPKEKISVLKAIFEGAKNSHGEQIYSGWYYDSGINQEGWRSWKLGDSQTAEPNARNIVLSGGSMTYYFMTPMQPDFDLMKFDFDKDTPRVYQTGAINDAISTDLSSFKANGGKLIVVTGASDPVFSAKDQVAWFNALQNDTQSADKFSRLFVAPGLTHCGGGNGLDDFDPLTALEQWHDNNQAPESLLAKSKTYPNKQMPICAYPKVATYIGGDENKATSFECR
ncbi:tannase/feruloyl esterase family alpha/beta hydrolase [Rodentibacter trehalosifermentans]|uniref:tannase/feruloyl esterase family alpha/beta hydrolase n=1 Tax=Rodentibacter trehalosifermentans TaxID=1908263 RepID=UPI0009860279|nr:tannase/feruloyl esterase family alpha/beta hydrolase [Rodentibacter trehalosifermentans]OOF52827.1 feruloyl esterase [Rodentibacter trehalosifermentans]